MKTKQSITILVCFAVLACAATALGAILSPYYVANATALLDDTGRPLTGTWGQPASTRCLVEVREVGTGIVAPTTSRDPDEVANPLLAELRMGEGVVGWNPGIFCATLVGSNRPAANKTYFVRVYNSPTRSLATQYADSEPFSDPQSDFSTTALIDFPTNMTTFAFLEEEEPLYNGYTASERDRLIGLDTDGDGWSDWFEISSGMDPSSAYSSDEIALSGPFDLVSLETFLDDENTRTNLAQSLSLLPEEELANKRWVIWQSYSGVTYYIEFTGILRDRDVFETILTNVADSSAAVADISDIIAGTNIGFFTIRAVSTDETAAQP